MKNLPFVLWALLFPLVCEIIRLIRSNNGEDVHRGAKNDRILEGIVWFIVMFSLYVD